MGGGIGMENTSKPRADSFQCMTKSTTIKKIKKLKNKIKIRNIYNNTTTQNNFLLLDTIEINLHYSF